MRRSEGKRKHVRSVAGLLSIGVLLVSAASTGTAAASPSYGAASFSASGSIQQVQVTGADPGKQLTLIDRHRHQVGSRAVNSLGGALFRNVKPGPGYRVREDSAQGIVQSPSLTVLSSRPAPPSRSIYNQTLPAGFGSTSGYGYLTTRDGTKLAINVQLPGPADKGPYPTLVEYSGYGYADPAGAHSSISPILKLLGYAVVDVNIRGTGCSGGAFDLFSRPESLDGYDIVETAARQPWALHHKVGLAGVSYGGITQLFVGSTAPPSLAAIAPLSVIDDAALQTAPGGILNTGFTLAWAEERDHDALPASSTGGQPWALTQIQKGDQTCKANQALHPEAVNTVAKIRANPFYVPAIADPLSPATFVHKIRSPVFLACQWTDEQTGGHCPTLARRFTGARRKWFTFTNGVHTDSLDPATFNRWFDFLELYVARRAPKLPPALKALAPQLYQQVLGVPDVHLPDDPIQAQPTYAGALAAFERIPAVRILFDNGAGAAPGAPLPGFEQSFARFPVPGTRARSWYLGAGGALNAARTGRRLRSDAFTWDPGARSATDFSGDTGSGGLWTATPDYHWQQPPAGSALSYLTSPLRSNTAVLGAGALQAWIKSSAPSVDLQVTVSEVRPDGKETFVQSGWLRASERKLDLAKSTLLEPVPSFREADVAPLPKGRWAKVTVPLYYEGHVYRSGSRIRVTISAPGGDQPIWAFAETSPKGTASVSLAHSRQLASRLILPVVAGVNVPTGLPPCPGLRGEPCRTYQPLVNRAGQARRS